MSRVTTVLEKYIFLHFPLLQGDEEDGNLDDMEDGQGCPRPSANDNGCCLESSALSSPRCLPGSDIAVAQGIQILPHLPKYSICIKKGPSGFLGKLLLSRFIQYIPNTGVACCILLYFFLKKQDIPFLEAEKAKK